MKDVSLWDRIVAEKDRFVGGFLINRDPHFVPVRSRVTDIVRVEEYFEVLGEDPEAFRDGMWKPDPSRFTGCSFKLELVTTPPDFQPDGTIEFYVQALGEFELIPRK